MGKKKFLDRIIEKTLTAHTKFETPSILNRLCKKYPSKKIIFWSLWQIKEFAIYLFWLWLLIFVLKNCNAYVLCKPCLDMLNTSGLMFNVSLENFTFEVIK